MRGQIGRCANEVMQEHSLEGEKTHSSSSIVELAPGTGGALPFDMIGEPSDGFFLFEALLVPKLRLPQGCSTNPRQLPRGRRCAVSKRQPAGLPHTEEAAGTRFERIRDRSRVPDEFCQPSVNPGLSQKQSRWHPHCSYPLR